MNSEEVQKYLADLADALSLKDYLEEEDPWERLDHSAPEGLPKHVQEAAFDIAGDMIREAGFLYPQNNGEVIAYRAIRGAFEVGFFYGAAFQAEPENHPTPDNESIDEGTVTVPTKLYFEMLRLVIEDKARQK